MSGLHYDFPVDITLEQLEEHAQYWVNAQRLCNWAIGDIARKAEAMSHDALCQVFPVDTSPGLIARCKAVSLAYPRPEDREVPATWTQYMSVAAKPDRQKLLQEMVNQGQTTDESRKAVSGGKPRYLLAIDVNYHLHRHYHSGASVEAAMRVTEWIQRTVGRLKEKGLTDVVCCFDSRQSFRKELTADWEDKYKDRKDKEPELVQQIHLVADLLAGAGFRCVTEDGFESDDLLASYAAKFNGRVTILTQDKDLRQCLSETCNMLADVKWTEDPASGELIPDYKWLSAKQHTDETGLRPDQWADYQAIMGDSVDGIKGAPGIGEKGAKDLIVEYGSLDSVLEAVRTPDGLIKPRQHGALLLLAERIDVVRQLVTLRTDLTIPMDTRV